MSTGIIYRFKVPRILSSQTGGGLDKDWVEFFNLECGNQALKTGTKPNFSHSSRYRIYGPKNANLLKPHSIQASVSKLTSPWENSYKNHSLADLKINLMISTGSIIFFIKIYFFQSLIGLIFLLLCTNDKFF